MFALFVGSIILTLHCLNLNCYSKYGLRGPRVPRYWIHVVNRQDDIQLYITYLINLRNVYVRVSNKDEVSRFTDVQVRFVGAVHSAPASSRQAVSQHPCAFGAAGYGFVLDSYRLDDEKLRLGASRPDWCFLIGFILSY